MPDLFDDLWVDLRRDVEAWVTDEAPTRFDREYLSRRLDEMPSMQRFTKRVDGMTREALLQAHINHVRRDAKKSVTENVLRSGTNSVRRFFRAELTHPALFGPDGLMTQPSIYELDEDALVPLRYLSIREAAIREERELKARRRDLETRDRNVRLTLHLLDQGEEDDGTFGEAGARIYRHFVTDGREDD